MLGRRGCSRAPGPRGPSRLPSSWAGKRAATATSAARPAVTKVAPKLGPVGGGTTVTISGSGFEGVYAVRFGSVHATSFTVNSATQITAVSPEAPAGKVDIRVSTPGGNTPISAA